MLESLKCVSEKKKKKEKKKPALNLESNLSEIFSVIDGLFSRSVFKSLLISD